MALMLLHEWELRREPDDRSEPDDRPERDPIDWRAQRWLLLAVLLGVAGLAAHGTWRLALLWVAMMVVVRRAWRELETVGGLGEHRQ